LNSQIKTCHISNKGFKVFITLKKQDTNINKTHKLKEIGQKIHNKKKKLQEKHKCGKKTKKTSLEKFPSFFSFL
jgi:hypothetical protein